MKHTDIKRIMVEGLHGQYDTDVELYPGLNILFGSNGSGKTSLLHILANIIDKDVERFCHIRFRRITIVTHGRYVIQIDQEGAERVQVNVSVNGNRICTLSDGDETPMDARTELEGRLGGRPVYLPAFRSVLEAIKQDDFQRVPNSDPTGLARIRARIVEAEPRSQSRVGAPSPYRSSRRVEQIAYKTLLCREWFGEFVPMIRCPSLWDTAYELVNEKRTAERSVALNAAKAFETVFYKTLAAIYNPSDDQVPEPAEVMMGRIANNFKSLATHSTVGEGPDASPIDEYLEKKQKPIDAEEKLLLSILDVYDKAIQTRIEHQEAAYRRLSTFEESVNQFLSGKRLAITSLTAASQFTGDNRSRILLTAGGQHAHLGILSSGERQMLTLLFSATHMSAADGIVLIDEPELSLHVDWQRDILTEMVKQAGDRQIIACTHSPEVAADHYNIVKILPTHAEPATQIDASEISDDSDLAEDLV